MSYLLKFWLTPAILLSFMFLQPVDASVVSMTFFAPRIHLAFFAQVGLHALGSDEIYLTFIEQNLHKYVKARFFLFSPRVSVFQC